MTEELPIRLARVLAARRPQVQAEWQAEPAAVLVPLYQDQEGWHVLFTLRTESVDYHRGQVSFPGGRIEPDESGPEQAALREAEEEIGISPADVRILGRLDPLLTITQFRIEPVVGAIPWPYRLRLNSQEVALTFGVPLSWLSDPDHIETHAHLLSSGQSVPIYYFQPYEGQVIWGATARITLSLVDLLRKASE